MTAAIAEDISVDMAAILDAERRLNSLMEQIEETSSSSETSVRTHKKRRDLTAPEFGVAAIQLKKITKIGNIILSSIEETTLPILSMRARDRGQKLLSNARKTNSETTEHDNHNQSEMAVIGPVDANADVVVLVALRMPQLDAQRSQFPRFPQGPERQDEREQP